MSEGVLGWRYTYVLPPECLKVTAVVAREDDNGCGCCGNIELMDYEVSGQELYSNHDVVYVRYTARIEDTEEWASSFTEAFVALLAIEVAMNVVGDKNIIALLERRVSSIIEEAKTNGLIREDSGLPKRKDKCRGKIINSPYMDYSGIPSMMYRSGGYSGECHADEFCFW